MILAANQDLFTAAGTGVLAVCVVAALAHVHFWVLLALVMGLFAGPTLSILGGLEVQGLLLVIDTYWFVFSSPLLFLLRGAINMT